MCIFNKVNDIVDLIVFLSTKSVRRAVTMKYINALHRFFLHRPPAVTSLPHARSVGILLCHRPAVADLRYGEKPLVRIIGTI